MNKNKNKKKNILKLIWESLTKTGGCCGSGESCCDSEKKHFQTSLVKKGGSNPEPKTPKPKITPPSQKVKNDKKSI